MITGAHRPPSRIRHAMGRLYLAPDFRPLSPADARVLLEELSDEITAALRNGVKPAKETTRTATELVQARMQCAAWNREYQAWRRAQAGGVS